MARLKPSVVRYPSDRVQGEGSFVEFTRPKWKAVRGIAANGASTITLKAGQADGESIIVDVEEFLQVSLLAWNWTDDDGLPLPLPKSSEALAELPAEEVTFLLDCAKELLTGKASSADPKG